MEDVSEVIEPVNSELVAKSTFSQDMLSIIISLIFALFLIIGANFLIAGGALLDLVVGIVVLLWGISKLSGIFTDIGSALNYKKAMPELDGVYLRKNLPVCPYLKSKSGGFQCLIEFSEPFNVAKDLPKCHVQSAYKDHWVEKAPNVFVKAQESSDRNLITYIQLLGRAKYEPAIPLLLKIIDVPLYDDKRVFVYEYANNQQISILEEKYYNNFAEQDELMTDEDRQEQRIFYKKEFDECLSDLLSSNLLTKEDDTIYLTDPNEENFSKKWKYYNTSYVKQFALASLTLFDDPKLVPKFLGILINSEDKKMQELVMKSLKKSKNDLEEPILNLIKDNTIKSEKKTILIELMGAIESDEFFQELASLSKSEDETLSYYAISALGKKGQKGIQIVLDILNHQPTDLNVDSGRASLANNPDDALESITSYIDEHEELSQEFKDIVTSILEELDHSEVKKYFYSLEELRQKEIEDIFSKSGLYDSLEYLITD